MNIEMQQLVDRIMAFQIDSEDASVSFVQRLARENNWSEDFSQRAVTEYKRFICLMMLSEISHPPSDTVDQVWHLHMTYTESYWTAFCGQTLNRQIHHHPKKEGAAQRSRYFSQYQRSMQTYQSIFGNPPADIWPGAEQRFDQANQFQRINTAKYCLLPKLSRYHITVPFVGLAALTSAACSSQSSENPGMMGALMLLGAIVGIVLVAAIVVSVMASKKSVAAQSKPVINSADHAAGISTVGASKLSKRKPDSNIEKSNGKVADHGGDSG